MTEKLTKYDRGQLMWTGYGTRAACIIDEQAAALTEARASLERVRAVMFTDARHIDQITLRHLDEALTANPVSPRAAAERAVLDACATLHPLELKYGFQQYSIEGIADAELARRAVKP